MRLLIVEDQEGTGEYLERGLRQAGFSVHWVKDGRDGLHCALTERYDLVVLDVMLPGLDGWHVLERLRAAGKEVPVLVLTARDQVGERVRGLDLGADDYLVKPFAFPELLARIRARLRRAQTSRAIDRLNIADLEMDLVRRRVVRAGQRIEVTAKEFALLELLMRHPGEVFPRLLIAAEVWDMNFDGGTNVIDVAVRRLRAKVDDGFEPKLIHTVRGIGYVLEARGP
ncbi:MAG: heavy metal response regulator transcription factor [Betaproteobacteria bacterium]|nr:heavy metal response regulator transcription factor [Betaproteobacteria bacterium]